MKRVLENLKSLILTLLILISLVLTGSLWFDNYQGLYLLTSSLHNNVLDKFSAENYSIEYDKIILPYKITIINPNRNKWIYYESDDMHTNAWNITKTRLNELTAETEIITGKVKEWDNLFTRKSIVLEFGGPLEYDILRLAIPNLPKETDAFNDVEKIGVTKSLEGNTIYILQNDNNKKSLYKILLKGEDKEIETFMDNCENVKADVRYAELDKVGTTKFYNNKEVEFDKGILFPLSNIYSHRDIVRPISSTLHFDMNDEYSINRFVIEIFNNTDFAKFVTNDQSNIFINDDKSSIKFEKNGVVEYINNSKLEGETISANKNFNTAMNFINNMRIYNNIYLLSAIENDGLYTFRFSVAFDGVIAAFEQPIIDDDMYALIEIQAEEDSVRYFKGKLLDMELKDKGKYIGSFTHNILDDILEDVQANTKVNIIDLDMIYVLKDSNTYYPSWIVKYKEKKSEEEFTSLTYTIKE